MTYVDFHEVQDLIAGEYGLKEFNLPASEEIGNGGVVDYHVSSPSELEEWAAEELADLKSGRGPDGPVVHAALQDMVNRGIIEPGIYVVEVCW